MIDESDIDGACLVLASSNPGKIKEFRDLITRFPFQLIPQPENFHVEENGKTFAENARLKALAAANFTGKWSLADDSGLRVKALSGAPGVYSARYADNDQERIRRLLKEMESFEERTASFHSALCMVKPNNEIFLEVEGICEGLITNSPRGENGFGYDPIFEVLGTGLTFAEMEPEQKQVLSHRGLAFKLLEDRLTRFFSI